MSVLTSISGLTLLSLEWRWCSCTWNMIGCWIDFSCIENYGLSIENFSRVWCRYLSLKKHTLKWHFLIIKI